MTFELYFGLVLGALTLAAFLGTKLGNWLCDKYNIGKL